MLKPVPIRLRAGLWMVSKSRDTIPPLPVEGRTSIDLPRDADREFYGAIGYMPLGNHGIRADMVERLAAMARQAVRESREAARRAEQDRQNKQDKKAVAAEPSAPSSHDEISEWAIVAAAFGEIEPTAEAPTAPEPTAVREEAGTEEAPVEAHPSEQPAPAAAEAETIEAKAEEPEEQEREEVTAEQAPAEQVTAEQATAEHVADEQVTGEEVKAEAPKVEVPRKEGPRPLPPGWFRAAPQMMSLVGCSEPEMADVLRGLGYRVHPPSEEHGPLYAFSTKPRFVREREEQRERQRQQQRQQREQRRRERPDRPDERQFFADTQRFDRGKDNRRSDGGPRPEGAAGKREDRPESERPREERRGPRPPRREGRDPGGPALRLYATTEKKGETPADSPFAKLLELKLGGKK
jgi:outer membrane biosynthesis protein TonB